MEDEIRFGGGGGLNHESSQKQLMMNTFYRSTVGSGAFNNSGGFAAMNSFSGINDESNVFYKSASQGFRTSLTGMQGFGGQGSQNNKIHKTLMNRRVNQI